MNITSSIMDKYFGILELLFNTLPYVFWKDKDGKYLGGNQNQALSFGFSSPAEFIGKTIYDILEDKASAEAIDQADQKIMQEDKTVVLEEKIALPQGEKYYYSQKTPIHNQDKEVIGLLGFAMDITELKQQEEIIRKERDGLIKTAIQVKERDRLIKVAAQVAHDIRSPAASVLMLAKSCKELPEKERIALREAAMRIQDIANNLLNEYQSQEAKFQSETADTETILVSTLIFQLAAEKRLQYAELPLQIDDEISPQAMFCFIEAKEADLKRALSNLVNNAVEAYDNKSIIKIKLKVEANNDEVVFNVVDYGKGIPPQLVNKILNQVKVTQGKSFGYGIGLTQVRETVSDNHGQFFIDSAEGAGTTMTMVFPRCPSPWWIADKILLHPEDLVIVLDDDISIHSAWDARFEEILQQAPSLTIRHFTNGSEVLTFIDQVSERKERIFLLTDYELLKQDLTGLEVILKSKVQHAVLVTSHYADPAIRAQAMAAHTKILPKQLASEVRIEVQSKNTELKRTDNEREVGVVLVDDDKNYTAALISFAFEEQNVVQYEDPRKFLNEAHHYPKNIKIFLDNNFNKLNLKGVDIAAKLHEMEFTQIYLLSGEILRGETPRYLTIINKSDLDKIKMLAASV